MSGIWNPLVFNPVGNPEPAAAPPALRVYGEATPVQRAMAQAAFSNFCSQARLSAVSNPMTTGWLPDGSRYRIVVVGPQTVMEIWPQGQDEELRRSGIGLALTTLDGGLVPGHIHKDEDRPQPYILTPHVRKGTRITNGKWRVRKVDGYSGGKAIWVSKSGKKSVTAFGGVAYDTDLQEQPAIERRFGTNTRAYWMRPFTSGVGIYTDNEKRVGSLQGDYDTVPFYRTAADGSVWLMQITAEFEPARLRLHGGPYDPSAPETIAPLGPLRFELEIPAGHVMVWQTVSVSPAGKTARLMMRRVADEKFVKTDLRISDDALAISETTVVGSTIPGTYTSTTVGDGGEGLTTTTEQYTSAWDVVAGGYGYDGRGAQTDFTMRYPSGRNNGTAVTATLRAFTTEENYYKEDITVTTTVNDAVPGPSIAWGDNVLQFPSGSVTFAGNVRSITENFTPPDGTPYTLASNQGTEVRTRVESGMRILFVDLTIDLHVVFRPRRHVVVDTIIDNTSDNRTSPPTVVNNGSETTTESFSRQLTVVHKGEEFFQLDEPVATMADLQNYQFVVSQAADPLTGAVCINILELDVAAGIFAPPLRSWIILADDVSAKFLHEVMDVPEGTGIRIKTDPTLLSVV